MASGSRFVFVMLEVLTSWVFIQEYFNSVLEMKNTNKAVIDFGLEKAVVTVLRAIQMNHLDVSTQESSLKGKA